LRKGCSCGPNKNCAKSSSKEEGDICNVGLFKTLLYRLIVNLAKENVVTKGECKS
jgi:hypothetical protein